MKKVWKNIVAVTMICALSAGMSSVPAAAAGKNPAISATSITMKTNDTASIRIKHPTAKVKWTSTDNKVVCIRETSGKCGRTAILTTGNKTGKCYVKASVGKKKFRCKVVVKKGVIIKKYTGTSTKAVVDKVEKSGNTLVVRVKMCNASKKDKWYGRPFWVEKYVNGSWTKMEMKEDYAFTCEAYNVPPKTSVSIPYTLSGYYDIGEFTEGTYRIHIDWGSGKKCNQYIKFKIS